MSGSIASEPEELLPTGESIAVRTRRGDDVGERGGEGGRGLQIETGVGPAQHQLIVQLLKIKARGRNARRVFDCHEIWIRTSCHENIATAVHCDGASTLTGVCRAVVAVGPERQTG